jgi:hypothetical protein
MTMVGGSSPPHIFTEGNEMNEKLIKLGWDALTLGVTLMLVGTGYTDELDDDESIPEMVEALVTDIGYKYDHVRAYHFGE